MKKPSIQGFKDAINNNPGVAMVSVYAIGVTGLVAATIIHMNHENPLVAEARDNFVRLIKNSDKITFEKDGIAYAFLDRTADNADV